VDHGNQVRMIGQRSRNSSNIFYSSPQHLSFLCNILTLFLKNFLMEEFYTHSVDGGHEASYGGHVPGSGRTPTLLVGWDPDPTSSQHKYL
jgi:hypothetical protein